MTVREMTAEGNEAMSEPKASDEKMNPAPSHCACGKIACWGAEDHYPWAITADCAARWLMDHPSEKQTRMVAQLVHLDIDKGQLAITVALACGWPRPLGGEGAT